MRLFPSPRSLTGCAPWAALSALVVALAQPGMALAERRRAKPRSGLALREQYEEKLVQSALRRRGFVVEPQPEGKRIDAIYFAGHDVVLPGEFMLARKIPWTLLNVFHARTRDYIIGQELLFRLGDPFRRDVFEETGRNLRGSFDESTKALRSFSILSVARLVPVRSRSPQGVGVLVVTKDLWSLRLNTSFVIDQARIDAFAIGLAEHNLAGRNKRVAFQFSYDPGRYGFSLWYADPRVLGSYHSMRVFGLFYINRETRALEGGQLQVNIGRPLFSLRTRLGWEAQLLFVQDIARSFLGGDIRMLPFGDEEVPDIFQRRQIQATALLRYSEGTTHKFNLGVGWRVQDMQHRLPEDFSPAISDAARQGYLATLPRSESFTGPMVNLDAFTARYVRLFDIQTLALSEDFRIGPQLNLEVRFASHHFGLPSDFVELYGNFRHTHQFRDNLLDYGASGNVRIQYGVSAASGGGDSPLVNQGVSAFVRNVSPRLGPLRLHVAAHLTVRARDLDNQRLTLGLDNGLRGFAPRAYQGNSFYRINVELRSKGLNLWTVHVGGVLFYDGGDAPAAFNSMNLQDLPAFGWHQNAGFGLRILLPQFNRDVIRLDLAFPFELAEGGYVPRFSAGFGQAF